MWIDSHCHIYDTQFSSDFQDMLHRTFQHVAQAVVINVDQASVTPLRDCVRKHKNLYSVMGLHPCSIQPAMDIESFLKEHVQDTDVALGETGLDFYHKNDKATRWAQTQSFLHHLEYARLVQKPVVVHTRGAEEETLSCLREYPQVRGVIHCFTGTKAFAYKVLDMGWMISLSGIITFRNAKDLHQVVAALPLQSLVVETDAPYLAPLPYRGQRNEPAYVCHVGQALANLLGQDVETVQRVTRENTQNLFGLPA